MSTTSTSRTRKTQSYSELPQQQGQQKKGQQKKGQQKKKQQKKGSTSINQHESEHIIAIHNNLTTTFSQESKWVVSRMSKESISRHMVSPSGGRRSAQQPIARTTQSSGSAVGNKNSKQSRNSVRRTASAAPAVSAPPEMQGAEQSLRGSRANMTSYGTTQPPSTVQVRIKVFIIHRVYCPINVFIFHRVSSK